MCHIVHEVIIVLLHHSRHCSLVTLISILLLVSSRYLLIILHTGYITFFCKQYTSNNILAMDIAKALN